MGFFSNMFNHRSESGLSSIIEQYKNFSRQNPTAFDYMLGEKLLMVQDEINSRNLDPNSNFVLQLEGAVENLFQLFRNGNENEFYKLKDQISENIDRAMFHR